VRKRQIKLSIEKNLSAALEDASEEQNLDYNNNRGNPATTITGV
jgi:hypothetical protein